MSLLPISTDFPHQFPKRSSGKNVVSKEKKSKTEEVEATWESTPMQKEFGFVKIRHDLS